MLPLAKAVVIVTEAESPNTLVPTVRPPLALMCGVPKTSTVSTATALVMEP